MHACMHARRRTHAHKYAQRGGAAGESLRRSCARCSVQSWAFQRRRRRRSSRALLILRRSPATSAPGLASPLPHLHRDWAQPLPLGRSGTAEYLSQGRASGPVPPPWSASSPTSAAGLGPHLRRDVTAAQVRCGLAAGRTSCRARLMGTRQTQSASYELPHTRARARLIHAHAHVPGKHDAYSMA